MSPVRMRFRFAFGFFFFFFFFVHSVEDAVYGSADHDRYGGEVEPKHQDDDGAEGTIGSIVGVEILKIDAEQTGQN